MTVDEAMRRGATLIAAAKLNTAISELGGCDDVADLIEIIHDFVESTGRLHTRGLARVLTGDYEGED